MTKLSELSFREFYDLQYLEEKLITFGGQAYPKFNNIVIMAGGAGSGKGFVKNNLVGMEGYTFDVDELKKLASKAPMIRKRVKDELGVDLEDLSNNLRDPENVSKLHDIIGNILGLDNKRLQTLYRSIFSANKDRKPNIIFDMTLKDFRKLQEISRQASELGYDKKNIHIVWVVNDIEVAKKQNLNVKRGRVVPLEILINTHRGVSNTMRDIIDMGSSVTKYMDGDIVFAFNKIGVDSEIAKSGKGGQYIKDANYFYIKRAGKPTMSADAVTQQLGAKIQSYVPKNVEWTQ